MSASQVVAVQGTPAGSPESAAPRKRRKRASAAGAAADCFTCANRNTKCDRRRPYCSQCLNLGQDCSGYKTQLTWGVGVASRGKLRGLSLPIAGTAKVSVSTSPPKKKQRQTDTQATFAQSAESPALRPDIVRSDAPKQSVHLESPKQTSSSATSTQNYDSHTWISSNPTSVSRSDSIKIDTKSPTSPRKWSGATLQPNEQQSTATNSEHNYPFRKTDKSSPMMFSASPQSASFLGNGRLASSLLTPNASSYRQSPAHSSNMDFPDHNPYAMYRPPGEVSDGAEVYEPALKPQFGLSGDNDAGRDGVEAVEELVRSDLGDGCAIVDDLSPMSNSLVFNCNFALTPFAGAGAIGKTPRMQYLIQYYTEVISPVIVAFDGPNNPYRTQILRLAVNSETLQHAISALSASNLRQRRETGAVSTGKTDPARRSSMAHMTLTDESWHSQALLSPQDQAREEVFHKSLAIQSLNRQLASPHLRKDDSILATLLVLCLFHICDSGVAKFQTQFAGVKKLLNLRRNELGLDSKESHWFTRMFTWFDAMTASVNDREGQLQGHHLDISALSDEEWALENLAGCDGKLFKTIAKLGRLNVLSQGKAVESTATLVSRPLPTMSFPNSDYSNFDGNGWMRIIKADEDLFTSNSSPSEVGDPALSTQFWREWREARHNLQTWYLDNSLFDSPTFSAPWLTVDQRIDLSNISESFRYSALLYTERLANPSAASTDANIQAWVRQSLNFIKLVKADVYLLWPLFITGSECVEEADRDVIRERCLDIQKDSGFLNNKSCLELLEKVWTSNPVAMGGIWNVHIKTEESQPGFRFTPVMKSEGNEGEYIVV